MKLIKRGAEADIYRTTWGGDSAAILKVRKPRSYRNPALDSRIRRHRTAKEAQALAQVKSFGVASPLVYFVNAADSSICLQEIPGTTVHDLPDRELVGVSRRVGRLVGALHKNGVMHGDLTTSNFILCGDRVFVIDFGLSQNTVRHEDYAVDLRLIKEILNSAHAQIMRPCWRNFLSGYRSAVGAEAHARVLHLVSEIESRGRYATVV